MRVSNRLSSRRWLAVSLRASLILVVVGALAIGWLASRVREQRETKAMVERHDGLYYYEFEPPSVRLHERKQWVPSWLRSWIGEDYFHDVKTVSIEGEHFSDAELERLRAFDRITSLAIRQSKITDSGLRHLRGSRDLEALWLSGNWIGDKGIDNLGLETLPKLEILELRETVVSDAKLAEIKERYPKLMLLVDGPIYRPIIPGIGRGPHGQIDASQIGNEPGGRRKIPPARYSLK